MERPGAPQGALMAMTSSVQYFVESRAEQHNLSAAQKLLKLATCEVYDRRDSSLGCSVPLRRVNAGQAQIASERPPATARLELRE